MQVIHRYFLNIKDETNGTQIWFSMSSRVVLKYAIFEFCI